MEKSHFRVVFIGDTHVGKTSIIHHFIRESFTEQQKSTVGAVFHLYEKEVNGIQYSMQIWDTAGQEKYRSLGPIYYRNASAGILVYDRTNLESFQGLSKWIEEFKRHTHNPIMYLVGNKKDLSDVVVDDEAGRKFAQEQTCDFYTTSAKTGEGIKELFDQLFDQLVQTQKSVIQEPQSEELDQISNNSNESGCC